MKRGLPKRFWFLVTLVLTTSISHHAPSQIPPRLEQPILTNGVFQFFLSGEADITYIIQSSPNLQNWTPLVTNSDCASVRSLAVAAPSGPAYYRAWARRPRLYGGAFSALAGVELKGSKVMVDSYNS